MDLQIEYISTADLVPYEKNTRKHNGLDVDNIARSIQKYGFNDPIGIWNGNVIIEGHGRLLAAQQLGMEKVPCVRLDHLTDEERREYAIAHNATAELSEWDVPNIEAELEELDLSEFDFEFGLPENVEVDNDESMIQKLLEEEDIMSLSGKLEKDEFTISFCFPIEYESYIQKRIKENSKEFYANELMKIMGVI